MLCLQTNEEIIDHLSMKCITAQEIWSIVLQVLDIKENMSENTFEDLLLFWVKKYQYICPLPIFVTWGIWLLINRVIFRNENIVTTPQASKFISFFNE